MPLSRRYYKVRVGPREGGDGIAWSSDDEDSTINIAFDITKTPRRGANKGKIELYNLGSSALGLLQSDKPIIQLEAGYEGGQSGLIFSGDIARVTIDWRGPDRVASLEVGEAELAIREARFDVSYPPGTTSAEVLADVAAAMGVGVGNTQSLDTVRTYAAGWTHAGLVRAALDELADDVGRRSWTVQSGQLYVLGADDAIAETGPVIAPDSGLIGSPKPIKKGIEFECLLRPEVAPKRAVRVESDVSTLRAWYMPQEVQYMGEYRGNDWKCKVKARERK